LAYKEEVAHFSKLSKESRLEEFLLFYLMLI